MKDRVYKVGEENISDNLERHFDCGKSILHISSSKNYYMRNFYDISFLLFFFHTNTNRAKFIYI